MMMHVWFPAILLSVVSVRSLKHFYFAFAMVGLIALASPNALAYDSQAHARAAILINSSCLWWQMGKISKGQIISFAKAQYRKQYGDPNKIDWNTAISIAEKVDKQKGLGCFS
jgi:hypothetical protein